MPELPEVETVARDLAQCVAGKRIRRLEIFDPKLTINPAQFPRDRVIRSVTRIGKEVVFDLSAHTGKTRALWLSVHLRMTGRLIYTEETNSAETRHVRAIIILDRGSVLFKDSRRFGTMRLLTSLDKAFTGGLDPLSCAFSARKLAELLNGSRQEIKPWLLRQDRLVGFGNIYASEALFAARIAPDRTAESLTAPEIRRLYTNTRRLFARAIKYCGTTISDFQNGRGQDGGFRRFLKVYGRENRPCRRCGELIIRRVQQGRSTYHCPSCQS